MEKEEKEKQLFGKSLNLRLIEITWNSNEEFAMVRFFVFCLFIED